MFFNPEWLRLAIGERSLNTEFVIYRTIDGNALNADGAVPTLTSLGLSSGGPRIALDGIRFATMQGNAASDTLIPEPSTAGLAISVILGALGPARRRR